MKFLFPQEEILSIFLQKLVANRSMKFRFPQEEMLSILVQTFFVTIWRCEFYVENRRKFCQCFFKNLSPFDLLSLCAVETLPKFPPISWLEPFHFRNWSYEQEEMLSIFAQNVFVTIWCCEFYVESRRKFCPFFFKNLSPFDLFNFCSHRRKCCPFLPKNFLWPSDVVNFM